MTSRLSQFRSALRKVSKAMTIGFGVAIALFFVVHHWSKDIPWSLGLGLMEFVKQMALAYCGGYMFWFVADHMVVSSKSKQMEVFVAGELGPLLVAAHHFGKLWDSTFGHNKIDEPQKRFMDSNADEIFDRLFKLYKLERDENVKHMSFTTLIRWWVITHEDVKPHIDHLVTNFRDHDIELTQNLEVLRSALTHHDLIKTLTGWQEHEAQVRQMRNIKPFSEEEIRGGSDYSQIEPLYGFSMRLANYGAAVRSLVGMVEEMQPRVKEGLEVLLFSLKDSATQALVDPADRPKLSPTPDLRPKSQA